MNSTGQRTRRVDGAARLLTGAAAWALAASLPALLLALLIRAMSASLASLGEALAVSVSFVALALLLAAPVALGAAIWLEDESRSSRLAELAEFNLASLCAAPTLAFALPVGVVCAALVTGGGGMLGGICVLTAAMLAPLIVSARASISEVSASERDAGLALGGTRWRVIWEIVLPAAGRGLAGGVLTASARGLGCAAPLLVLLAMLDHSGVQGAGGLLSVSVFEALSPLAHTGSTPGDAASAALLLALLSIGLDGVALRLRAGPKRSAQVYT